MLIKKAGKCTKWTFRFCQICTLDFSSLGHRVQEGVVICTAAENTKAMRRALCKSWRSNKTGFKSTTEASYGSVTDSNTIKCWRETESLRNTFKNWEIISKFSQNFKEPVSILLVNLVVMMHKYSEGCQKQRGIRKQAAELVNAFQPISARWTSGLQTFYIPGV